MTPFLALRLVLKQHYFSGNFDTFVGSGIAEEIHRTKDPETYAYSLIPHLYLDEGEHYNPNEDLERPQVPEAIVKAVENVDSLIRRKDA